MGLADDFSDLDPAFGLPDWVEARWKDLYEVLVSRMRREASGLPMNTVMQLLIERVAALYIYLKMREEKQLGDAQGFSDAMVAKNWNAFWMSVAGQFTAELHRAQSAKPSDAFMERLKGAIATSFAKLEPSVRNEALSALVSGFADMGL